MVRTFIIFSIIVFIIYGVFLYQNDLFSISDTRLTEFKSHCSKDKVQFCKDISIGSGRLFTCLRHNKNKISGKCGDYLSGKLRKVMTSFFSFRYNCGTEYQKFCSKTKRGEGNVIRCLYNNYTYVSKDCRKVIWKFKVFTY